MKHQLGERHVAALGQLKDPHSYYSGRRVTGEALPDNIIVFHRQSVAELYHSEDQTFFHHRWILLLSLTGSGTLLLNQRECRLESRQAILVPPLHLHAYRKLAESFQWLFVTFDWPGHAVPEQALEVRRFTEDTEASIWTFIDIWNQASLPTEVLAAYLFTIIRQFYPTDESPAKTDTDLLARVRLTTSRNPMAKVAAVAKEIGMSESHLRACFRSEVGISLGRYLREMRLQHAAQLLHSERVSVAKAAECAGFTDPFTFSRAFTRLFGQPPSTFRRKVEISR